MVFQGKRILIKLYLSGWIFVAFEKTYVLCQIDILQFFCLKAQSSKLPHLRKPEGYKLNKNPQQP